MTPNYGSPTALQRTHIHGPITALAFYSSSPSARATTPTTTTTTTNNNLYLLSGQDTHLHIHAASASDPDTSNHHPRHKPLASIQIFPAQPIQGISASATTGDVLLWGGPYIALLTRERITQLILLQQSARSHPNPQPVVVVVVVVLEQTHVLRGTDWIYHASLASATLAAVVTAHNEVVPLHITRESDADAGGKEVRLRWGRVRAPPSSRPILYAARLEWMVVGQADVLVAAGTAFGEIVVWRCRVNETGEAEAEAEAEEEEGDDDVEVLYVFTGHEGSIFGMDISPEVIVAGRTTRLLASCSDDRTIRVWDVSNSTSAAWGQLENGDGEKRKKKKKPAASRRSLPEARETGFGENGVSDLEAQAGCVSSEPVAMAMGHVSRIWNARFASSSNLSSGTVTEGMAVYSFGEDATAQRWRLDIAGLGSTTAATNNGSTEKGNETAAAPGLAASLTHEAILHRHSGKHIWSSAILPPTSPDVKTLVATGGSDGKINIVEEVPAEVDTRSVMLDISGTEIVRSFPDAASARNGVVDALPKATKRKKANLQEEPFLMYALLSAESVIATTSTGRIFSGSLRGSELSWSEIVMPHIIRDDLRQYQIVRSAGAGIALLGSTSGIIYSYRDGVVEQVCKLPGKISDIFAIPLDEFSGLGLWDGDCSNSLIPIIVSTMGSSMVTLLVLNHTSTGPAVQRELVIELEKGCIPTAVGCCKGCLIFGSRNGALTVYKPVPNGQPRFERAAQTERPFTKDAVSSIIPLPSRTASPAPYFLTTSRDGRYRIYEITTATTDHITTHLHLRLRHEALPPLGPMIESAIFTPSTPSHPPELVLAGFRSKYFIVWNETRQIELANVECGGAFRSFTHRVDPSLFPNSAAPAPAAAAARTTFIWTRASRTCVYAQTALSQRVVKPGGHGREIKAAAAMAACDAAEMGLFATGAEDTTVRIWEYHGAADCGRQGGKGLRCLAVIEKHTTGIQCLKWAGAYYLLSSSGNEELYIWRVTRLDKSAYEGLAVVCEGVYPDKTRDGDLRILGFDVVVLPSHERSEDEVVLCLSLVLSNSTLKTYRYSRETGFALLAEGRYTGACLMQIRHLRVSEAGGEVHIITAATDGHIALWKMSAAAHDTVVRKEAAVAAAAAALYELVEVVPLHQSSIKSLDLRPVTQQGYIVVTGGDDNALGYLSLAWSSTRSCYMVRSRSLANGAHAAAVTGLCITGVEGDDDVVAVAAPGETGCSVMVCTASNDQRVKTWRIVVGGDDNARARRVKLVQDRYSAVADCGDLEMLNGGRDAVVVGVGMEIWESPSR